MAKPIIVSLILGAYLLGLTYEETPLHAREEVFCRRRHYAYLLDK